MILLHGNAVGVYILDAEGDHVENYWKTGHNLEAAIQRSTGSRTTGG
jgi:hypothetical protein